MNSKERVICTINHQQPDRVPVGDIGVDHDHISKILGRHTYVRNRKDTTLALWEGRRDEVVQSLKYDYAEFIEKMDYDTVTVELVPAKTDAPPQPTKKISDGVWEREGKIYKYAASNDSIQCMTHSEGKEELSQEDIDEAFSRSENIDPSCFELIDFLGERFGDERALVFRGVNVYDVLMRPFGGDYNHQLMLPLLAPDDIKRMYEAGVRYNKKMLERCAQNKVLIAMETKDFAMNSGSIMSPDTLREIYFPFMKMVNDEIAKLGMHRFFHCCGNTWSILDDFIEAGFEGYQSIQMSAGMDWAKLKQQYGDKLTLWAGVQCETLIEGSMEQTEQEVKKWLPVLMPGGGFIFGSTNSVQYGANTDNYLRALEVVRKHGIYS